MFLNGFLEYYGEKAVSWLTIKRVEKKKDLEFRFPRQLINPGCLSMIQGGPATIAAIYNTTPIPVPLNTKTSIIEAKVTINKKFHF